MNNSTSNPIIFDSSDGQELRINMISPWLKKNLSKLGIFSDTNPITSDANPITTDTTKIIKLSLDGGFTCPNRDGSKGTGGCLFCSESGSGDMAGTVAQQIALLSKKWPSKKYNLKYIAYFQSHTNTYAPVEVLREKFEEALTYPNVIGLAVATRPDCISEETLDLLSELNEKTFLWVELGLQTIHDTTANLMNLCHNLSDYDTTANRLANRGIRIVTHLIFGLPGETREMMLESVAHICTRLSSGNRIFGLKLHMLNVVRGSGIETIYPKYVPFSSMEEYIDLIISALEIVPPEITMHRISGDAPRATLIAPEWSYKKRTILNSIHRRMREKNTWQGRLAKD